MDAQEGRLFAAGGAQYREKLSPVEAIPWSTSRPSKGLLDSFDGELIEMRLTLAFDGHGQSSVSLEQTHLLVHVIDAGRNVSVPSVLGIVESLAIRLPARSGIGCIVYAHALGAEPPKYVMDCLTAC